MPELINPERYGEFIDDLAEMHRLRYRIFNERLGWDVQIGGDKEIDEFDARRHVSTEEGRRRPSGGCVRLLPTTRPTMLCDTFRRFLTAWPCLHARRSGKAAASVLISAPGAKDGRQHRSSDLPTVHRHDQVRLNATAHRHRHHDGCPDGADLISDALAFGTSRFTVAETIAVADYLEVFPEQLQPIREAGHLDGAVISAGGRTGRFAPSEAMERAAA
jgi:acyl homoserine lactone synthase